MESKKYPRTPHLPYSPGGTDDDERLLSVDHFIGQEVVITEKMDGENMGETCGTLYARSHNGAPPHPSFDLAKATWACHRFQIPEGVTVFSEWCFAEHSIHYSGLPNYRLVFGVRDDGTREAWSWDEVCDMATELGVPTVPELWRGQILNEKHLRQLVDGFVKVRSVCDGLREGVVVRLVGRISLEAWELSIAKWVRPNHVKPDDAHWRTKPIVRNGLRK